MTPRKVKYRRGTDAARKYFNEGVFMPNEKKAHRTEVCLEGI